ncbi:probable vesicular glutamate transporter eat-4 [Chrysoperla carnea]|uniref:probable vesicular glutamate transporter eat-4 n=1 Tax=Chrysoperla carnea TaxID=189513 RepID=UPI001D097259|nr:probable vesicular glutamate transporter eat-4 [Chrysoperla carnea]
MDPPKMFKDDKSGCLKFDRITIINKRFTLSFLMNIGFTIMFCGITLSHVNRCLMSSIDPADRSFFHASSYLLGLVIIQIPAAWCSLKFSPITWFGRSILLYSILLFVLALFSFFVEFRSYGLLVAYKFTEGVVSGTTFVVFHAAWKNWTPSNERSTFVTFAIGGCFLGDLLGELLSKYCSELLYWEYLSGLLGITGIVWWLLWKNMVYETPEKHRTITEKEYNKIYPSIQQELDITENVTCKKIIFSMPFLVLVVVNLLRSWNSAFYLYRKEHMYIILIIKAVTFPIAGYLADVLVRQTSMTITRVRKLYISGIFLIEVIYFLLLRYCEEFDGWLYFSSFVMQVLHIAAFTAASVNALDIAPSHAGVTIAIINIISHIGYQVPFKIELYLYENNWLDTFNFISIMAHLIGGIIYGIYGSAKPITVKKL